MRLITKGNVMDCRTCRYNTYGDLATEWVSCCHPVTIAKMPKWEEGDPSFVYMRTGDLRVANIADVLNCPTWEQRAAVNGGPAHG